MILTWDGEGRLQQSRLAVDDPPSIGWVQGVIRTGFDQAHRMVNEVIDDLNSYLPGNPNPIPRVPDNAWDKLPCDLFVFLHEDTWIDEFGRADAGLYHPNTDLGPTDTFGSPRGFDWKTPRLQDRIECAWSREVFEDASYGGAHHVLRHEFGHMISRHAFLPGWDTFGHGGVDDPYRAMLKRKMDYAYRVTRDEYPATWKI